MAWTPHWTKNAWSQIKWLDAYLQARLLKAVREFAATGRSTMGTFHSDGPGTGTGHLVVGIYDIDLARKDEHRFVNDDGEEITIRDAIAVLGVTAVDPNP
jgi:hypothetical protein